MRIQKNFEPMVKRGSAKKWLRAIMAFAVLSTIAFFGFVAPANAAGATQIAGTGHFARDGECVEEVRNAEGRLSDFAIKMNGDLDGCLYTFVESWECAPSGTYRETGTEIYVGSGREGDEGRFSTTFQFEAKYEDCANLAGEIHGRCQHPIVAGSGTGDFEGVTGRLDFKDEIGEVITLDYRGHLRY